MPDDLLPLLLRLNTVPGVDGQHIIAALGGRSTPGAGAGGAFRRCLTRIAGLHGLRLRTGQLLRQRIIRREFHQRRRIILRRRIAILCGREGRGALHLMQQIFILRIGGGLLLGDAIGRRSLTGKALRHSVASSIRKVRLRIGKNCAPITGQRLAVRGLTAVGHGLTVGNLSARGIFLNTLGRNLALRERGSFFHVGVRILRFGHCGLFSCH